METCSKCGTPLSGDPRYERHQEGGVICTMVRDGFKRGRLAGMAEAIEVAKRLAYLQSSGEGYNEEIEWDDVDDEIKRRMGGE